MKKILNTHRLNDYSSNNYPFAPDYIIYDKRKIKKLLRKLIYNYYFDESNKRKTPSFRWSWTGRNISIESTVDDFNFTITRFYNDIYISDVIYDEKHGLNFNFNQDTKNIINKIFENF